MCMRRNFMVCEYHFEKYLVFFVPHSLDVWSHGPSVFGYSVIFILKVLLADEI